MISISRIVGISGSRDSYVGGVPSIGYPRREAIHRFIRSLPQDHTCMIVSGGALGVDTVVIECAKQLRMPYAVIPYYSEMGKKGGPARDETLVDFVHELYAFWNLKSPGTLLTIKLAKKRGKLRTVFGPSGEPIETYGMID